MPIPAVDHARIAEACTAVGLDSSSLSLLHQHATSVYLLGSADVVIRVSRGPDRDRARTAVTVTRWLVEHGFPATAPTGVTQPVDVDEVTMTFWRHYPQHERPAPPPAALGTLLRQLHQAPAPPVQLSRYQPLTHLQRVLAGPTSISESDQDWLQQQVAELLDAYRQLSSELGEGLIHGDAYPGNTLWDGERAILGDWDEVAYGPRELDLVNTHQGARFGRSADDRAAFTEAYGWDVTKWSGFSTLRTMRDLHTIATYIERSNRGDVAASDELRHRVATLREGDLGARWRAA